MDVAGCESFRSYIVLVCLARIPHCNVEPALETPLEIRVVQCPELESPPSGVGENSAQHSHLVAREFLVLDGLD
jgi:hypothetical protein